MANSSLNIQLVELEHQTQAVDATMRVFKGYDPDPVTAGPSNPCITRHRDLIRDNIEQIQQDPARPIPLSQRGSYSSEYLGIDVHMETGTGKTLSLIHI